MTIDRANAERISVLLESAIRQLAESIEIAEQVLADSDITTVPMRFAPSH
jgi:hypothetical protein